MKKLIQSCRNLIALAQWITGRPDQTYVLITTDDSKIRVVASSNLTTEGACDLIRFGLEHANSQHIKERLNVYKKR